MTELRKDINDIVVLIDHNRNLRKNGGTKSELGNIQIGLISLSGRLFGYTSPVTAAVIREAHSNPEEFRDEEVDYRSTLADYNIFIEGLNKALQEEMQPVEPTIIASNSLVKR